MDSSRSSLNDVDALDRRAPGLPALTLTLLTLLAGCLVVLGELDRLVGMALARDGYSASVTAAESPRLPLPFPVAESRPWLTLHQVGEAAHPFVGAYLVVDALMALVYGTVLWRVTRRVRDSSLRHLPSPGSAAVTETPLAVLSRPRVWPVSAVVAADLLENLLLWALVAGPASTLPNQDLVRACAVVTGAKWVLIALAVLPVVYALVATRRGHVWVRSHWRAVVAQRYSLLAFAPIAAIALLPGDGVLDQLPDVQRTWLDGTTREGSLPGLVHLFWAVLVLSLIALGLFFLGRLVTDITARRRGDLDDPPVQRPHAALWQWAYGPAVLLGLALVLVASGQRQEVRWLPLAIFCSVPVAIIVASWWLRRRQQGQLVQPPPRRYSAGSVDQVQRLGDLLALAGPVVAMLALVRSHTVLLALGEGTPVQRAVPVIALVGAVATWWVGPLVLDRLQRMPWLHGLLTPGTGPGVVPGDDTAMTRAGVPRASEPRRVWFLAWLMILVSTVLAVALCTWPVFFAHQLGAIGAVLLALGVVTLLVGSTVVVHASYAPPEIFWISWLRLREAPVATLLTVSVLAAILSGSNQQVHGVRGLVAGGAGQDLPPAPAVAGGEERSLDAALARWGERSAGCAVRVPDTRPGAQGGEVDAIPLVLVAAEGGGIRAAYWTAAALEVVGEELPCGLAPVAVASGVSGGAVGLAVSRFTSRGQQEAVEAVWRMGGPDALAQASLGLVLRDPVYTVAGIPSTLGDAPGEGWLDRAGLMETTWESQADGLDAAFLAPPGTGEGGLAADLVLNSTAVSSGCRVLVSAVTGSSVGGEETTRATTCADLDAPLPFSRDLVTDYLRAPGEREHCLGGLAASTAAMLASRFPYVTPSGVLGPCGGAPEAQLIDGGYAEGSGLGTLSDLAPTVLRAAAGTGSVSRPVLPLVLYLDNGRGSDIVPPPPTAVSEVLVPPVGYLNAGSTQKSTAAFLQRLVSQGVDGQRMLRPQVYVVSQRSEPAVEAPLGWVLSQASRDDMDGSLDAARARADRLCAAGDLPDDELWRAGGQDYPQLPELLALVRPGCAGGR